MRKWYLPLTVLGLGSLGVFLLSDAGHRAVRWIASNVQEGSDALLNWDEAAQRELDRIQIALNRVAESLQGAEQTAH